MLLPYDDQLTDLCGLHQGERDPMANAANTAATIDSPSFGRFAEADRAGCEAVAAAYVAALDG